MRWVVAGVLLFTLGCGSEPAAVSSSSELTAALAEASPGDVVEVGAGTFEGRFEVPAGVTLEGAGVDLTRIVAPTELDALVVTGGEPATTIADVSITVDGGFGIRASGGRVAVRDVTVDAVRGAGVGVEDAVEASLTRLSVTGPITAGNAMALSPMPTPGETATHGVVLVNVERAGLSEVQIGGTAVAGVVAVGSDTEWTGGGVTAVVGTGVFVAGGRATLTGVGVQQVFRGVSVFPAYGVLSTGDATITSDDLTVEGSEDVGVVLAGGSATHAGLIVRGNDRGGVVGQTSAGLTITDGSLDANGLVGLAAREVDELRVEDTTVSATEVRTQIVGAGMVDIADGIQIVASPSATLASVSVAQSERVGLLMDADGGALAPSITDLSITGSDDQLGAVAQNGEIPPEWDSGVTRDAVTSANDAAWSGTLELGQIVAPTEIPSADSVRTAGLSGIVAPTE